MKIDEQKIITQKTARYFTLGDTVDKTKAVWFVIHGYGFLAQEFIKSFEIINNGENYIIAPEGLNRFYLKGFYGKVGATWMTKESRIDEINDYIEFLDSVYEQELSKFNKSKIKINVLGFSQGAPTAARWLINGRSKADNFILWAGDLPEDTDLAKTTAVLKSMSVHFVIGNKDELITPARLNEELKKLKNFEIDFTLHKFNGGHQIDPGILQQLSQHSG